MGRVDSGVEVRPEAGKMTGGCGDPDGVRGKGRGGLTAAITLVSRATLRGQKRPPGSQTGLKAGERGGRQFSSLRVQVPLSEANEEKQQV